MSSVSLKPPAGHQPPFSNNFQGRQEQKGEGRRSGGCRDKSLHRCLTLLRQKICFFFILVKDTSTCLFKIKEANMAAASCSPFLLLPGLTPRHMQPRTCLVLTHMSPCQAGHTWSKGGESENKSSCRQAPGLDRKCRTGSVLRPGVVTGGY